jgi:hypothetical protein
MRFYIELNVALFPASMGLLEKSSEFFFGGKNIFRVGAKI